MAHPYKQKYNNFNGPGHESPAPYISAGAKLVKKLIWKPVKRKAEDIWNATVKAFGPVKKPLDTKIDWKKTKQKYAYMTGGGIGIKKIGDFGMNPYMERKEEIAADATSVYNPHYKTNVTTTELTPTEAEQKRKVDSILKVMDYENK